MKYFSRALIILAMSTVMASCYSRNEIVSIRAMTFNVRYDNPGDSLNAWPNRKELAIKAILDNNIDIVGMQEVLLHQQQFIESRLTGYDYYAVGRDDGKTGGEMGSIFFRKDRFDVLDKSTFWLSETPDSIGSIGWNAVLPRIVSWVKLHDKENDKDFYFFNTHFSHVGEEARTNSAKLLVKKIAEITEGFPVIVTGDFNCTNDSEAYATITDKKVNQVKLFDTHFISETEHFGGMNSINGFGRSSREAIIDYLFCNSSFNVKSHGILTIKKDGVFVSDHYPVMAELVLLRE